MGKCPRGNRDLPEFLATRAYAPGKAAWPMQLFSISSWGSGQILGMLQGLADGLDMTKT